MTKCGAKNYEGGKWKPTPPKYFIDMSENKFKISKKEFKE